MTSEIDPKQEFERVLKLAEYDIDYSTDHPILNDLSKLAAHVAGMPISQINLLGPNTQWTLSSFGIDIQQMPRNESICQFTILETEFFEANGLDSDQRFKNRDYVKGDLQLKYYFGVPITTKDGHNIGSICVMDNKLNKFPSEKIEMLSIIGNNVLTILDQIKSMKELKQEIEEMEESSKKLTHDIRGPINGIIGLARIADEQIKEGNFEDIASINEMIHKSSSSLIDLAEEILGTHKQDINANPILKYITLKDLQNKLQTLFDPQAESKNLKFEVRCGLEHRDLKFSKQHLLQIIGNLITNAVKFTPEEGTVKVNLDIETNEFGAQLKISIQDTGIGMLEEQVSNLVKKEDAISSIGTNKERGFGFGFQLAKRLIQSLNGTLEINSERGVGTTINVSLHVASELSVLAT
ncbi:MAG: GAF domain-containing sensor histidine kinase [Balneolaceae bacterium]|nr:GAF domain-containing sensor histidine kinase [Balneolaceae bacterium]MBO6546317.1 GAF domain-containing sensor histidine kinase [Balneolaceae bacterium]MBO6648676.1 GAF domain-containing sensor histidine kinase [Balneolaceae bacterium]